MKTETNVRSVPRSGSRFLHAEVVVFAGLILLSVFLGIRNRDVFNTDAVAYLRLAEYWGKGEFSLAVSGYWGPFLSWICAAFLKAGVETLFAGHLAMAVSAAVFFLGSWALLRAIGLKHRPLVTALGIVAVSVGGWSAAFVSPDLLMGGLVLGAMSAMLSRLWSVDLRIAVLGGVLWGGAYYAKAIAFPLAVVVIPATCFLRIAGQESERPLGEADALPRRRWIAPACTVGTFLLIAMPWVLTLSVKYGHPTFSTTGRIAHAIVGPPDVDRYHPFSHTLHVPEPGRVTSWEDPTRMDYQYWSPLESRANLEHQFRLMVENAGTIVRLLAAMDFLALGVVGLSICCVLILRSSWRKSRWRIGAVALLGLVQCGGYIPTYVRIFDERYFYVMLPVLLGIALSLAEVEGGEILKRKPLLRQDLLITGVLMAFLFPGFLRLWAGLQGFEGRPSIIARELAVRLGQGGIEGPFAGSAMLGGQRVGLFSAFFLGKPWLGDLKSGRPEDFRIASKPAIVVTRSSSLAAQFRDSSDFHSADSILFTSLQEAEAFPVQVFIPNGGQVSSTRK